MRQLSLAAIAAGLVVAGLAGPAGAEDLTGRAIMERFDKVNRSDDEKVASVMHIISSTGQRRSRKLLTWRKVAGGDDDMILIRFLEPADVKGTGMLTIEEGEDDTQLLYLPDLRKSKRIAGASKANSFVGSDFSNYDMRTEDLSGHHYELVGEEEVAGNACYKVKATPKNEDVEEMTGYKQRFFFVDKERWVGHRVEYFDRNMKPLKVLVADDFHQIKGLWRPLKVEMTNTQQGSKTVVLQPLERELNEGLSDSIFTRRNLEKP